MGQRHSQRRELTLTRCIRPARCIMPVYMISVCLILCSLLPGEAGLQLACTSEKFCSARLQPTAAAKFRILRFCAERAKIMHVHCYVNPGLTSDSKRMCLQLEAPDRSRISSRTMMSHAPLAMPAQFKIGLTDHLYSWPREKASMSCLPQAKRLTRVDHKNICFSGAEAGRGSALAIKPC